MPDSKFNLVTTLSELISTPSISCTQAEWDQSNMPVIEKLAAWLTELGFKTEIMLVDKQKKKANLLATLGTGTEGLVLAGHTDTVPYDPSRWLTDPFKLTEKNNRFYGLGTCDMKGFFAIVIEAVQTFINQPLKQPLIILATADEESSMNGARALAEAGYPKARYALIGEPTGLKPVYMHKGMMMETIKITGSSGHSSNPSLGASALDAMQAVLSELVDFRKQMQHKYQNKAFVISQPTLNLGCIHGGDNPNRICGQCDLEYDIRPIPGMDLQGLRQDIAKRINPIADKFGVSIQTQALFPEVPPFANSQESTLLKAAEKLTGETAQAVAFATEAPFLQKLNMDTIVIGPGYIDQAHQPNEYLAFEQIKPTVALLQKLIKQFCL